MKSFPKMAAAFALACACRLPVRADQASDRVPGETTILSGVPQEFVAAQLVQALLAGAPVAAASRDGSRFTVTARSRGDASFFTGTAATTITGVPIEQLRREIELLLGQGAAAVEVQNGALGVTLRAHAADAGRNRVREELRKRLVMEPMRIIRRNLVEDPFGRD